MAREEMSRTNDSGSTMRMVRLHGGAEVPALGQGAWNMGDEPGRRAEEIAALRAGLDLGMTLIDTAEMYGRGASEELIGEAIVGRRDQAFLVSKVLPQHATESGIVAACEASLRRLGTDRLDLYLMHWRGATRLDRMLAGFTALVRQGKIRYWGVSNFEVADMEELVALPGGDAVATNQVLYNLSRRGIESELLPWCAERGIPVMAYSPVEQGRLLRHTALVDLARRRDVAPARVALAWVLRREAIIAIPKASRPEHVRENRAALDLQLTREELEELDQMFPPPRFRRSLEMH